MQDWQPNAEQTAAIDSLFTRARIALAQDGVSAAGLQAIGRCLQELTQEPWLHAVPLPAKHGGASSSRMLRSDGSSDLTLTLARFPVEAPTPVHNHGSWAVGCVVSGRDRHQEWRRLDDGSQPGRAQLRMVEERLLQPGDFVYWFDPPGDIHSQQGQGEPALELVLFGRNASIIPRLYFDPVAGVVREALPA